MKVLLDVKIALEQITRKELIKLKSKKFTSWIDYCLDI